MLLNSDVCVPCFVLSEQSSETDRQTDMYLLQLLVLYTSNHKNDSHSDKYAPHLIERTTPSGCTYTPNLWQASDAALHPKPKTQNPKP